MSTLIAKVLTATPDTITVRYETRITPAEFFRGRYPNAIEESGYYAINRLDSSYSWGELEELARNAADSDTRRTLTNLLTQARTKCPERRQRTAILDTEGVSRTALLTHITRPELGPAKHWEAVCTVRVSVATDGTWCGLVDVQGTTDMGITHEVPSAAALGKKLGHVLVWAYEKKHGSKPKRPRKPRKALPKGSP